MMQQFKNIDEVSLLWNVNPYVLSKWCIEQKINATYINNDWFIDFNQVCPLQTIDEHLVYLLDQAAKEFNELGAKLIYYNGVYVYTNLILKNDKVHDTRDSKVIFSKDDKTYTTPSELAQLCYIQYSLDYQSNTGCYPIFLKEIKRLKR